MFWHAEKTVSKVGLAKKVATVAAAAVVVKGKYVITGNQSGKKGHGVSGFAIKRQQLFRRPLKMSVRQGQNLLLGECEEM